MNKNNNKHHKKTNDRGLVARPRHYLYKQRGAGLLEILLIILIGLAFMVFAIRHYNRLEYKNKVTNVVTTAQDLLRAGDRYYDTYCAQNVTGLLPPNTDRDDPYKSVNDIQLAEKMLNAGQNLTVDDLKKDSQGNSFLNSKLDYAFPFGTGFDIKIIPVDTQGQDKCASNSQDSSVAPNATCLGQTKTWQVIVSACFKKEIETKSGKKIKYPLITVKSMFNADKASDDASDCDGIELQWISTPRVQRIKQFTQGQVVTNGMQQQNNNMYRYGPWMRPNEKAKTYDAMKNLQPGFNYICQ